MPVITPTASLIVYKSSELAWKNRKMMGQIGSKKPKRFKHAPFFTAFRTHSWRITHKLDIRGILAVNLRQKRSIVFDVFLVFMIHLPKVKQACMTFFAKRNVRPYQIRLIRQISFPPTAAYPGKGHVICSWLLFCCHYSPFGEYIAWKKQNYYQKNKYYKRRRFKIEK